MKCCEPKGHLSYLLLWIIYKHPAKGSQIALELEKRRGSKPSPGTIYPALKDLKQKGLVQVDGNKTYTLTKKGEKELELACQHFHQMFYDFQDMMCCCKKK